LEQEQMPFDIGSLTPQERTRYRALGQQYATADVLAQASKSLNAYELYGHLLAALGFGADDGGLLFERRGFLRESDTGHIQAVDDRRFLGKTYQTVKRDALDERLSARTLASMSISPLNKANQPELAQRAELVLQQTSNVTGDKQLVDQLNTLHEVLTAPALATIIATRGGPGIIAGLQTTRDALIGAMQARAGKPEVASAAEYRDILDGAVIVLCRAARDASRVAARRHGQPAIAAAFKLDLLRRSRSHAPTDPGAEDPVSDLPEPTPEPV
jgi:hypothetical protein